jgi:hypothetical protein
VETQAQADTFEAYDPQYQISGSTQAEAVYTRDMRVDLSTGEIIGEEIELPTTLVPTLEEDEVNTSLSPESDAMTFVPTLEEDGVNTSLSPESDAMTFVPTLEEDEVNTSFSPESDAMTFVPTLGDDEINTSLSPESNVPYPGPSVDANETEVGSDASVTAGTSSLWTCQLALAHLISGTVIAVSVAFF